MSATSQSHVAQNAQTDHNETYVGIDVSQDSLAVHILPTNESFTAANSADGIKELVKRFQKIAPKQILFEATGGLERQLLANLAAAGMAVVVLNPRQARDLSNGLGQGAKTDRVDAKMLAKIASLDQFPTRPIPSEETMKMNDLVTRKQQLIDMQTMEKNRLHMAKQKKLAKKIIRSIEQIIDVFRKQIDEIDDEINAMIKANPDWSEKDKTLRSCPGVGKKTAQVVISAVPEIGDLTRKQIARLTGLAPMKRQSGKWTGESHIAGGRSNVRCALYMAAMNAIKTPGVFKALYDRIRAQNKPYKVAIVAVMRKLITVLNVMIKTKTSWNEHGVRS
jgi:transposase